MPEATANLESRTEALLFRKADLEPFSEVCFRLYPLSDRMVAMLLSLMRYAEWDARWEDRDKDTKLVSDLEHILLSFCLDDLVKTNLLMVAALTGTEINLDTDLNQLLTGQWDFRQTGLANRLGPEVAQDSDLTTNAILEKIRALLEAQSGQEEPDYTEVLTVIATVLGAAI